MTDEKQDITENNENNENEVKLFTDPQKVVKKKYSDILIFQSVASGIVLAALLLLRYFLPEVFENIHALIERYICL